MVCSLFGLGQTDFDVSAIYKYPYAGGKLTALGVALRRDYLLRGVGPVLRALFVGDIRGMSYLLPRLLCPYGGIGPPVAISCAQLYRFGLVRPLSHDIFAVGCYAWTYRYDGDEWCGYVALGDGHIYHS